MGIFQLAGFAAVIYQQIACDRKFIGISPATSVDLTSNKQQILIGYSKRRGAGVPQAVVIEEQIQIFS